MRIIDVDKAIDRYYAEWEKQDIWDASQDRNWLMQCLDEAPTVEVKDLVKCHLDEIEQVLKYKIVEVVHGRWEMTADGAARCTACGRKMNPSQYGYPHCSLCGARMDGE